MEVRSRFIGLPVIIGNTLEWYDFAIYGFLSPIFILLFFPSSNPHSALLLAFTVFAIGFLSRPVGGIIFGYIGDKWGRKKSLVYSIYLIAFATALTGLLPTYEAIGIYAGLILTLLRLLQGIAVGGEMPGTFVYLVEENSQGRRGFFGSFSFISSKLGLLLATLITTLLTYNLSKEELYHWGWRLPFLFGAIVGVIGIYMRLNLPESKQFIKLKEKNTEKFPLISVFKKEWIELLQLILLNITASSANYLTFYFLPAYEIEYLNIARHLAMLSTTINVLLGILLIPVFGILSDKFGRRNIMILSIIPALIVTYPGFLILTTYPSFSSAFILQLFLSISISIGMGALPALSAEMFVTSGRYSAISFAYNIGVMLGGGFAPMIASYLLQVTGNLMMPAHYMMLLMLIIVMVCYFVKEKYKDPLK